MSQETTSLGLLATSNHIRRSLNATEKEYFLLFSLLRSVDESTAFILCDHTEYADYLRKHGKTPPLLTFDVHELIPEFGQDFTEEQRKHFDYVVKVMQSDHEVSLFIESPVLKAASTFSEKQSITTDMFLADPAFFEPIFQKAIDTLGEAQDQDALLLKYAMVQWAAKSLLIPKYVDRYTFENEPAMAYKSQHDVIDSLDDNYSKILNALPAPKTKKIPSELVQIDEQSIHNFSKNKDIKDIS